MAEDTVALPSGGATNTIPAQRPNFPNNWVGPVTVLIHETAKAKELFHGLTLASVESDDVKEESVRSESAGTETNCLLPSDGEEIIIPPVSDVMSCVTCSASFVNRNEQIEHYKSDWHRFNLKSKLKGNTFATEEQFENMTGDISSISGSDSEAPQASRFDDDEEESYHIEGDGRRHPRVFLRNDRQELMSIYRCLLYNKKNAPATQQELLTLVHNLPSQTMWCLLMMSGGHFAAAIFDGADVVVHKTFHRYVVRAKRGTVQSARDQKGSAPKSGGATLRRYNEAALNQEIVDLLKEWSDLIKKCSHIMMRVPTSNRPVLFQGKAPPLDKKDPRLRNISFQTRRPTFKEIKRTHTVLASVHCHGVEASFRDHVSRKKPSKTAKEDVAREKVVEVSSSEEEDGGGEDLSLTVAEMTLDSLGSPVLARKPRRRKKKGKKEEEKEEKEEKKEEEIVIESDPVLAEIRNELFTACKIGDSDRFHAALETVKPRLNTTLNEFVNDPFGPQRLTLLHVTAKSNNGVLVRELLALGCDPVQRNSTGQYAYQIANKGIRNHFKMFAAEYPERYNYLKAQIPTPVSAEEMNEKKEKEAEKRRIQRKARKLRIKEDKETREKEEEEEAERKRYLNLSDREKRALAAEKRILTQKANSGESTPVLSRCWFCASDMTGKIPFEYFDYKFCSPKCLKEHKIKNK